MEDFGASLDVTCVLSIKVGGTGSVSLRTSILMEFIYKLYEKIHSCKKKMGSGRSEQNPYIVTLLCDTET